jgi:hypothetical protein
MLRKPMNYNDLTCDHRARAGQISPGYAPALPSPALQGPALQSEDR